MAFALLLASILLFFFSDRLEFWLVAQEVFTGLDSFVLLAVPFFILAGNVMNESRVTHRLIRLAHAFVGPIRGGLGMVNVGTSMVFSGISGSTTADTAGIGSVLIPQMRERGYSTEFSVAVTASSSVMGAIIPPSILLVVWGATSNTSIGALFLGGILPGIMIALSLMVLVYLFALREGYVREERLKIKEVWEALWGSLLALGIPVMVVGGIVLGIVTATEASVLAVLYALTLGLLFYRTIGLKALPRVFLDSARLSSLSLFALAAASVFAYLVSFYRLPVALGDLVAGVPAFLLLPFIALIWLIIGTFLDALPAMIIMIPIFDPAVTAASLDPVHYGIVSIMALSVGYVTPPYGLCLLLASSIAGIRVVRVLKTISVFIAVLVLTVLAAILFPEIVLFLPDALSPATGQ